MSEQALVRIAQQARDWIEGVVRSQRVFERGRKIDYQDPDLCGYCAIASGKLHQLLERSGFRPALGVAYRNAEAHVYVLVDDMIVDVTATQFREFRNQPVVIMHEREAQHLWYYCANKVVNTVEQLVKLQKKDGWPSEQIAHVSNYLN